MQVRFRSYQALDLRETSLWKQECLCVKGADTVEVNRLQICQFSGKVLGWLEVQELSVATWFSLGTKKQDWTFQHSQCRQVYSFQRVACQLIWKTREHCLLFALLSLLNPCSSCGPVIHWFDHIAALESPLEGKFFSLASCAWFINGTWEVWNVTLIALK